jgi:hypothetical protein
MTITRRRLEHICLVLLLATLGVTAAIPAVPVQAGAISKAHLIPAKTRAKLLRLAILQASVYHESRPYGMYAVRTSRKQADRLFGVDGDHAKKAISYILAMRGHFTTRKHPRGVSAPHGTVLLVALDARTLVITDTAIQRRYPRLRKLGKPVRLRR